MILSDVTDGCDDSGRVVLETANLSRDLLEQALRFYSRGPDGQYDLDVVVPLIAAELVRRLPVPE